MIYEHHSLETLRRNLKAEQNKFDVPQYKHRQEAISKKCANLRRAIRAKLNQRSQIRRIIGE